MPHENEFLEVWRLIAEDGDNGVRLDQFLRDQDLGLTRSRIKRLIDADLAMGGGGTTTWERAWLGLPSIVVILAENQRSITEAMEKSGSVWNLGFYHDVTPEKIREAIEKAMFNPDLVREMSLSAQKIFGEDGRSGVEKLYHTMKEIQDVTA